MIFRYFLARSLFNSIGAMAGAGIIIAFIIFTFGPKDPKLKDNQKNELKKERILILTNYKTFYKLEEKAIYKKYDKRYKVTKIHYHDIEAQPKTVDVYFVEITQTVLDAKSNLKYTVTGSSKVSFKDRHHFNMAPLKLSEFTLL